MLSRNLEKARSAFVEGDVQASIQAHQKKVAAEKHNMEQGQYIKSVIYGGLDGIITTFAVVAGVAGASLSAGIILILGFANLIADGLSMAIGDYLSTKAEMEYQQSERKREEWEVEHYPEGEKMELIELYIAKGLSEEDATQITEILAKNKKTWVDVMMVEELGIIEETESPMKNAIATFFSFLVFGFIPLCAFLLANFIPGLREGTFTIASVLTGLTLFILGALKVKITTKNWFLSGLEMLIVGGVAAAVAFGIGTLLAGLA